MGGAQMMLVLGALVLLSLMVLNINRAQLESERQMSQAEYILAATAVGQSMISEISSKHFDATTASNESAPVSSFTSPHHLGAGSWESYPNFNDFDDFHRFNTTVNTPRAGNFRIRCLVDYVDPMTPNVTSGIRTRTKRLRVNVSSDFLDDPVNLVYYKSH
ncbi:MAG: hypothetical protein KFH87_05080 [Bacteroidetes bacterium]|nr:hypothetical protein [Bacteroidota bacterium]